MPIEKKVWDILLSSYNIWTLVCSSGGLFGADQQQPGLFGGTGSAAGTNNVFGSSIFGEQAGNSNSSADIFRHGVHNRGYDRSKAVLFPPWSRTCLYSEPEPVTNSLALKKYHVLNRSWRRQLKTCSYVRWEGGGGEVWIDILLTKWWFSPPLWWPWFPSLNHEWWFSPLE